MRVAAAVRGGHGADNVVRSRGMERFVAKNARGGNVAPVEEAPRLRRLLGGFPCIECRLWVLSCTTKMHTVEGRNNGN